MGISSLLPLGSTRCPALLIRHPDVQTLLPFSCRESRERVPSPGAKAGNGKVDFQAAHFISIQKSILFISPPPLPPPLPPLTPPHHLSFSLSSPFASPLSSFTQVGGESGTSRRRSAVLYTGASYPLLYGRMGEGEKEWGKKKKGGGLRGGKT